MMTFLPYGDFALVEASGTLVVRSTGIAKEIWSVRKLGNKAIAIIAFIPVVLLLTIVYGVMRFSVWRLSRLRPFKGTLTFENYKTFRNHYQNVSALAEALFPITQADISKKRWGKRIFLSQAVKAAKILLRQKEEMSDVLAQLDQPFDTLPDGWQVFTTDERWKAKPKPYEYIA